MNITEWWPQLDPSAQAWLIKNNGDVVSPEILDQIVAVAGPPTVGASWVGGISEDGFLLSDEATDWVEEIANAEEPDEGPYGHS